MSNRTFTRMEPDGVFIPVFFWEEEEEGGVLRGGGLLVKQRNEFKVRFCALSQKFWKSRYVILIDFEVRHAF